MGTFQLRSAPAVDLDILAAFEWYEAEQENLGMEFTYELDAAYKRIIDNPLKYGDLKSGIRRVLLRRFPYAIYFSIVDEVVLVLAVLHAHRDPAVWQRRGYVLNEP